VKLSIFTTVGNVKETPKERGDPYKEAINCYKDLANEVVVVAGGKNIKRFDGVKYIRYDWEWEFDWTEIPKHMNAGLEACTGDWVIRMDLDTFFYEDDFDKIRHTLKKTDKDVVTFEKFNLITTDRVIQKCSIPLAIRNDKNIKLGKAVDKKTDLCWPIYVDKQIDKHLYQGRSVGSQEKCSVHAIVYDCTFKTKEQVIKNFWRFSKAHNSYFGGWQWGENATEAYETFLDMMRGRNKRSRKFNRHPKYIKKRVNNIKINQFGYNGWGQLNDN
jgi:hypothetical protein